MTNNNQPRIQFHYLLQVSLQQRTALKGFIINLFKKEKVAIRQLSYIFCSDDYLLEINRNHLQHDFYTDIITFDLSNPGEGVVGEIYISIDRVKDNAKTHQEPFYREMHRVIFHGALHLCGYKDKTPVQEKEMRKKEEEYLGKYF